MSRLAAVDAGEALLAPGIGGLLVPTITRFGPEGGVEEDRNRIER
jgi:hypothetical protein